MMEPTCSDFGRYQTTRWDGARNILASVRPSLWGCLVVSLIAWWII